MSITALNLLGEEEKRNWRAMEAKYVQKPFAKALRQMIDSGYIYRLNPDLDFIEFTSTANTWAGSAKQGKMYKDMGYRRGWLDLTLIIKFKQQPAFPAFLECKFGDGGYSESQAELAEQFDYHNIRFALIKTPREGFNALRNWGIKC